MKSILILCLVVCFYCGHAQVEEDTTSWTEYLNEIIVSANRWEQSLIEVPNKISTISASALKFQNPQTAADLLTLSQHVFVQKSQMGGGSPMLRGFSTNRVLLVVDGVRMNNAIFRSGNVQNVISLDANSIEEAEVIFGPGSVIYGSDAIGGVMDFHTLKPVFSENDKPSFKGNALSRYASANNEMTAHFDLRIGLKKWAFVSSVSYSDYDDLRMGRSGLEEYTRRSYVIRENNEDVLVENTDKNLQVPTGYGQFNAMQKIAFRGKMWSGIYAFHFSETSDYSRYDRLILTDEGGGLANAEWYYGPQRWMMNSLTFDFNKRSSLFDHSRVVFAYQDFGESRHSRLFGSDRRTNRWENVKAFSFNLDLDKKLSETLGFYYGAEFITNEVGSRANRVNVSTGEITQTSTRYPDGSDWRTYAAYASLKIKASERWVINLSSRFTHVFTFARFDPAFLNFPMTETTLRNPAMNWSAGLIYNPSSSWKFYANLSTGFRAPNIDDIGKVFDSQPGNVVVPNEGLEPERAYNAETGLAGFAGDNVKIDLSLYYTIVDNAIARGPDTFDGQDSIDYDGVYSRVLSLQNISQVKVGGVQASVEWLIGEGLKVSSTFNYQKGREKDPETGNDFSPAHVAPMFGSTHIVYSKKHFKGDLYATYNGAIRYEDLALTERGDRHLYAQDENGNPYSPTWLTLNFKGSYQVSKHIAVNCGVENITNKRYRPYSSGISAPGRNLIIALRATF